MEGIALKPFTIIPELEDLIFEWCARLRCRETPALALVSKRIQRRVEPIIYHTIKLSERHRSYHSASFYERFLFCLRARPKSFFAAHVVNLEVMSTVPRAIVSEILDACTGVRNLALWQHSEPRSQLAVLMRPLSQNLKSLCIHSTLLPGIIDAGLTFPDVEHLSIVVCSPVPPLGWLPNVTSVEMGFRMGPFYSPDEWLTESRTVLASAPRLQRLQLRVADYNHIVHTVLHRLDEVPEGDDPRISVDEWPDDAWWRSNFYE
ncbi:hypothetical protein H0H81_008272 [Sphagnurus paluster]|uniref:Uncharacterized protein n=1 Tax=Sphagnurus paluster TaxID=117069 RepID=A0A9P7FSB1_9AGAR|nr:hypothetical protein H0H81_008272 [Sphagnurus paluster]